MGGTLSRCPEPWWLLSGMPLDVAANGGVLRIADRLTVQDCLQCTAQIAAIQWNLVSWAAAVELASVAKDLKAGAVRAEQIELRRAGSLQCLGQALLLIEQIREIPLPLLRLMAQTIGIILRVSAEAVAGNGQQGHSRAVVVSEPAELGLHMLYKGAVSADQHHEQWLCRQLVAVENVSGSCIAQASAHHG